MLMKILEKIISRMAPGHRSQDPHQKRESVPICPDPRDNEAYILDAYGHSGDVVVRRLKLDSGLQVLVAHIDGLVDHRILSANIVARITDESDVRLRSPGEAHRVLKDRLLTACQVWETDDMTELLRAMTWGSCIVIIEGRSTGLYSNVVEHKERAVEEPGTEASIRGSKEGFNENLRTNTSLLRRRVRDPRLWIEERSLGNLSHTRVALIYIKTLVREEVVQEIRSRLDGVEIDSIQESGQLEELIEDAPYSPFPTVLRSERLDRAVGALFEGRAVLIIDGTPFVLLAPITFFTFLSAAEDYFERWHAGTVLRGFRLAVFIASLVFPSLYVAVTTFHQELLPTVLLVRLAAQREGVAFPAAVEAVLMEAFFEVLREAGVRLPRIVGPAISIVGVLILGETAVQAGLVSSALIIVVAMTAIASFATPGFSLAISARLLRFPLVLLAGTLGLFGIYWAILALLIHLVSLRSLGVPYLEPMAPTVLSGLKDTLVRAPWWKMDTQPELIAQDEERVPPGARPEPPGKRPPGGEKQT